MKLRPYQEKAVSSTIEYYASGQEMGCISIPTGCGKSFIQAELIRRILMEYPHVRILSLCHSKELVKQNHDEVLSLWPACPTGIYSAGLKRRDTSQVLFAGIQSVHSKHLEIGYRDLCIIDECHAISGKNSDTMYHNLFKDLKAINPNMQIFGMSATTYRLDSGNLVPNVFKKIIYEYNIIDAIKEGYLCEIISAPTRTYLDTSGVKIVGKEYAPGELERAVDKEHLTRACIEEVIKNGEGRKSWLGFAAGTLHAEHINDILNERGIDSRFITDKTPSFDRDDWINQHKSGQLKCLVNNAILTTGYNNPRLDLLFCMRPTQSKGLWVQICGRGTRLHNNKNNCIVEGSMVLTDHGLIKIENITRDMKVWDGLDFVSHDGIIFRGEQDLITYCGLTATPDHKVWTKKGWMEIQDAAINAEPICVTGDGWTPIKLSDCVVRRDSKSREKTETLYENNLQYMRIRKINGSLYIKEVTSWVQKMWEGSKHQQTSIGCSKMAVESLQCSKAKMSKPKRQTLQRLWSSWYTIQIWYSKLYGQIYNGQLKHRQVKTDRQDKQRWSLRAWEYKNRSSKNKYEQPKEQFCYKNETRIQKKTSRSEIRGLNFNKINMDRVDRGPDCGQVLQSKIPQTKGRVWDILNAGPRHRFTCQGLLVSNCLILDFGGNLDRHGPIDKITGDDKKPGRGGDAPKKQCPICFEAVFASSRYCPSCGFEFDMERGLNIEAQASTAAVLSIQLDKEQKKVEQRNAKTLDDLIKLGRARGYKNPRYWAECIMKARKK